MSIQTIATWIVVIGVLVLLAKPLGTYVVRVFTHQPTILDRPLHAVEDKFFHFMGVSRESNMTALEYGVAFVLTNMGWALLAYAALRLQGILPFNPEHFKDLSPGLAFNTAMSFVTNTNWQAYGGGHTMSYFSQFAVLSYLQFVTPAAGGAAGIAFIRALSGRKLGNFFVQMTLFVTRLLLPLSIIVALLLVALGVPETLGAYLHVHTITGQSQLVPRGPIASFEAIEHLGQNGGGYTNANSANPLENPTALTNVIETIAMGLIPVAFFYAFGVMTGKRRLAWTLIGVAGTFYLVMLALIYFPEAAGNPIVNALGLHGTANMVGKELRFGLGGTAIFETSTMAFTTGSVASAHDSYLPLSSLAFFLGMFLNMVFGGKGVGLLNMLMFVILTIFLTGLMVGRTPEFMGKKLEAKEVSLTAVAFLIHPFLILAGTAIAVATPAGLAGLFNPGPHGLSEILYAFTSGAANNGSAFGGLNAALPFYEVAIGIVMVLGRYASVVAMLFVGQSLLAKRTVPESSGTLKVDTPVFGTILWGSIVILNALTFFPVMAIGPIAEQYLMLAHRLIG
ncbi:MAG: potassium-transporting ATPase subunit A [Sulfobacillus acidophilus]|uniref:Potassium-transporting ATPase potassium-binding subunit n=1 Tax=Sulfobacillus acidophilus TaxID=53633 RepID=A0A2T2WHG8_9FIRM|nr:MAG: potassium-transporting ATPase subunit A [Sulfobacillus acidophilus]